ncbi:receptor-like protein 48 [Punica granatum]|uniref:Receptor-like protein 48 n=1 Tax=Punica granatum TaxID=22663 RepID=A0A6P8EH75_PUNGR|nr:receptor-like protein 48 [Punica granatum]
MHALDLQSIKFHGGINEIPLPPLLFGLILSDNKFEGPLPIPPPALQYYIVSDNKFGGDIPHQICNAFGLKIIDLSNNSLTGSIPHCFTNFYASLLVLNLRGNNFFGQIPEMSVQNTTLTTISLSQNRLGGTLPQSLAYCENLEVLDLSKNELESRFPFWLETLANLPVLVLRSNKFYGPVDSSSKTTSSREIPEAIGQLEALKGLNFSHNNLTGIIPSSIENLANVEWLDLSSNLLTVEIPITLAHLSFLSYLNLSMNQLVGPIPWSTQMDTFKSDSFDGNRSLSGHPLPKACGTDSQQSRPLTSPEGSCEANEIDHLTGRTPSDACKQ